jgi:transcriptional regulator with XRE-family HTH domain
VGFKENLKSELNYTGMLVKELSAKTGIKKHTLDNYLNSHNSIPNAETAVKIAQALGVSVEYLITGKETQDDKNRRLIPYELRPLVDVATRLSAKNLRIAVRLLKSLEQEESGKV